MLRRLVVIRLSVGSLAFLSHVRDNVQDECIFGVKPINLMITRYNTQNILYTSIEFRNRVFSLRMYFHTTTTNNRLWYFAVIGNNDILILAFCGIDLTMQTLLSHNVVQLKKLSKALRDNLKTKSNINNNNKLNIIPGDNSEYDEKS